ncbi:hypothetical protein L227DRAFT_653904 [Lentinus tigrinus ALCF2SS1-6]|uniref:Uncharacterized protein n=1 Tax=Lentinus tigrinus ALCF2SS1-6 TaxID=1328759 RepID=A0A5C2S786_9APHY|nr:hypothetical protein L227DRAFT_653904 [Lentinus tigrinus ALCF2SS1-6]
MWVTDRPLDAYGVRHGGPSSRLWITTQDYPWPTNPSGIQPEQPASITRRHGDILLTRDPAPRSSSGGRPWRTNVGGLAPPPPWGQMGEAGSGKLEVGSRKLGNAHVSDSDGATTGPVILHPSLLPKLERHGMAWKQPAWHERVTRRDASNVERRLHSPPRLASVGEACEDELEEAERRAADAREGSRLPDAAEGHMHHIANAL